MLRIDFIELTKSTPTIQAPDRYFRHGDSCSYGMQIRKGKRNALCHLDSYRNMHFPNPVMTLIISWTDWIEFKTIHCRNCCVNFPSFHTDTYMIHVSESQINRSLKKARRSQNYNENQEDRQPN